MTLNIALSFVALLAVIAVSWGAVYALLWLAMRLSAIVPYTGKKHRHARWGEDLTRHKDTRPSL